MKRRILTGTTAALIFLAGAIAGGSARPDDPSHTCPTEDSCAVDYRAGQWVIVEVTP